MKIADMTTEHAADVLITVIPEIEPILRDGELQAAWAKRTADDKEKVNAGIEIIKTAIPVILGKYRENSFRILGAINQKTRDEIAGQPIMTTIKEAVEIFTDKELLSFFIK